jgi:hypothetical protein
VLVSDAADLTIREALDLFRFTSDHIDPLHEDDRIEMAKRVLADRPLLPVVADALAALPAPPQDIIASVRAAAATTGGDGLVAEFDAKLAFAALADRLGDMAQLITVQAPDRLVETFIALLPDEWEVV